MRAWWSNPLLITRPSACSRSRAGDNRLRSSSNPSTGYAIGKVLRMSLPCCGSAALSWRATSLGEPKRAATCTGEEAAAGLSSSENMLAQQVDKDGLG